MKQIVIITFLAILTTSCIAEKEKNKKTGIWFNQPATTWNEAIPIGNGAALGIGFGSARKLAEAGPNIALLDISEEKDAQAQKEIESLGVKAIFIKCDVRLPEDCKNAVSTTNSELGRIDILHNNGGVAVRKNAVDLEPEEWDLALGVSRRGQYLMSKYVFRK